MRRDCSVAVGGVTVTLLYPLVTNVLFASYLPRTRRARLSSAMTVLSFDVGSLGAGRAIALSGKGSSACAAVVSTDDVPFAVSRAGKLVCGESSVTCNAGMAHIVAGLDASNCMCCCGSKRGAGCGTTSSVSFAGPMGFAIVSRSRVFSHSCLVDVGIRRASPGDAC